MAAILLHALALTLGDLLTGLAFVAAWVVIVLALRAQIRCERRYAPKPRKPLNPWRGFPRGGWKGPMAEVSFRAEDHMGKTKIGRRADG